LTALSIRYWKRILKTICKSLLRLNKLKRIALVSDIHGNIPALEAVVADIKRRGADIVINLGDHISGPLWPKETIKFLGKQDWIHIRGNHDNNLVNQDPSKHGLSDRNAYAQLDNEDKKWLADLPATYEMENGLFLFHAAPSNDNIYLLETVENGRCRLALQNEIKARLENITYRTLICGHTHIQRVVQLTDGALIINPGSVGLQAFDYDIPEPHKMETGSPHARYAIIENINGNWSVDMILIEYNYRDAVKQAEKNNRRDWAIGLQTGFMDGVL
jgi:putative phosphoesterase